MQLPLGKSAGPVGLPVEVWRGWAAADEQLGHSRSKGFLREKTSSCLERRSVGTNMERLWRPLRVQEFTRDSGE